MEGNGRLRLWAIVSSARDSDEWRCAAIGAGAWDAEASLAVTIENNQLISGAATTADGIIIAGSAGSIVATIRNNAISDWEHGIRLKRLVATGSTVTDNTITNNISAGSGIHIEADFNAANVSVSVNNIVRNQTYGIYHGGSGILNAACNWWGPQRDLVTRPRTPPAGGRDQRQRDPGQGQPGAVDFGGWSLRLSLLPQHGGPVPPEQGHGRASGRRPVSLC